MNPNALDRTAAWLLNMNVQYLDQEGMDPDTKHREDFTNKEELTQTEKVIMELSLCIKTASLMQVFSAGLYDVWM